MAIAAKKTPLGGLAGKLLSSNILSEEIISAATADAEDKNLPLVRYLIEHNLVDSKTLAKLISEQFGLPLLDLSTLTIPSDFTHLVSSNLIEKNAANQFHYSANLKNKIRMIALTLCLNKPYL